jgi:glycosyltransferase involved in cell wall biosynthesis
MVSGTGVWAGLMRVAFTLIGGKQWTGGYNYLRNLVQVLGEHAPGRLTPVLFFGEDTEPADLEAFRRAAGAQVVYTPLLNQRNKPRALLRAVLLGRDAAIQRLFDQQRIDVVFEAAQFFGRSLAQPAIAWIPDFQHLALPQLFNRAAYWRRELGFRAQVAAGRTIMLSSEDSRQACERLYPATRGRTCVIRFAIPPPAQPLPLKRAQEVARAHGLPEQFFFMPNQFWAHKNHLLVVDALARLRKCGRNDIVVAASGKQIDPRNPGHVQALRARITALSLEDNFRLLGLIPYEDLLALMRASTALLNPSLFEGWSTTVEEARALGVPMLLSDLDVHREQAGADATYFDRRSAQGLADTLQSFAPLTSRQRDDLSARAWRNAAHRVQAFGAEFAALVECCATKR